MCVKLCAFSPKKTAQRQKFYICRRSRYIYIYHNSRVAIYIVLFHTMSMISRDIHFMEKPRRQDWEPPCFFGCRGLLRTRQIRANEVNPGVFYLGWSRGVFLGSKVDLWSVPSGKITNYHIAMDHPWERNHQNGGCSRAMLVNRSVNMNALQILRCVQYLVFQNEILLILSKPMSISVQPRKGWRMMSVSTCG